LYGVASKVVKLILVQSRILLSLMNYELERMWKEAVVAEPRYYPSIFFGGPEESNEKSRIIRCPCQDSNQTPLEYKSAT
jgi:hypothetical protein